MRQVDVAVIGAGQAGLATSYWLTQRGIEHVVLERGQPGESWRSRRWDSFMLNSPNWSFDLPGYPYQGDDPDAFMGRAEIVARFEDYARKIDAPVESEVEVTSLKREIDGGYLLTTTAGEVHARAVVAATGAYQRRHRPPENLEPSILQLHTDQYRNPAQLPPGGVLVVGAGQSGCQVVEDLRVPALRRSGQQQHVGGRAKGPQDQCRPRRCCAQLQPPALDGSGVGVGSRLKRVNRAASPARQVVIGGQRIDVEEGIAEIRRVLAEQPARRERRLQRDEGHREHGDDDVCRPRRPGQPLDPLHEGVQPAPRVGSRNGLRTTVGPADGHRSRGHRGESSRSQLDATSSNR